MYISSVPNSFEEYPVLEKHPIFRFVQRLDWGTQWELARAIQSGSIDVDEIEVPWILELVGQSSWIILHQYSACSRKRRLRANLCAPSWDRR